MRAIRTALAIAALGLTGALAPTASATRLWVFPEPPAPPGVYTVSGTTTFEGGLFTIRCALTLSESITTATFAKTAGSSIARLTRAEVRNPCEEAFESPRVTFTGLPTAITYSSFTGTLPNITSYLVRYATALSKGPCTYSGTVAKRYNVDATGTARTVTYLEAQTILRLVAGFPCEATLTGKGTMAVNPPLRVLLI